MDIYNVSINRGINAHEISAPTARFNDFQNGEPGRVLVETGTQCVTGLLLFVPQNSLSLRVPSQPQGVSLELQTEAVQRHIGNNWTKQPFSAVSSHHGCMSDSKYKNRHSAQSGRESLIAMITHRHRHVHSREIPS